MVALGNNSSAKAQQDLRDRIQKYRSSILSHTCDAGSNVYYWLSKHVEPGAIRFADTAVDPESLGNERTGRILIIDDYRIMLIDYVHAADDLDGDPNQDLGRVTVEVRPKPFIPPIVKWRDRSLAIRRDISGIGLPSRLQAKQIHVDLSDWCIDLPLEDQADGDGYFRALLRALGLGSPTANRGD